MCIFQNHEHPHIWFWGRDIAIPVRRGRQWTDFGLARALSLKIQVKRITPRFLYFLAIERTLNVPRAVDLIRTTRMSQIYMMFPLVQPSVRRVTFFRKVTWKLRKIHWLRVVMPAPGAGVHGGGSNFLNYPSKHATAPRYQATSLSWCQTSYLPAAPLKTFWQSDAELPLRVPDEAVPQQRLFTMITRCMYFPIPRDIQNDTIPAGGSLDLCQKRLAAFLKTTSASVLINYSHNDVQHVYGSKE